MLTQPPLSPLDAVIHLMFMYVSSTLNLDGFVGYLSLTLDALALDESNFDELENILRASPSCSRRALRH